MLFSRRIYFTSPWRGEVASESEREGVNGSAAARFGSPLTPPRAPAVRDPPPPGEGKHHRSRDAVLRPS